ncbi:MAG TPA: CGNR zinc finger domain-containing protein, partial [Pseudonocardia sp.]|nr:CGNR zinc finger domain-containing protein [Pseudonocardia sp.]
GQDAVLLAVDLVNRPPRSARELTQRCRSAGVVDYPEPGPAELDATLGFLEEWTTVVDAPGHGERAAALNALLARATSHPRLTDHVGGWHLHFRDDGLHLAAVLAALIATGTALHLTGRGMDRLGRCGSPTCGNVYADVSRNGRQRYCSPRCANQDAVRRHRARRKIQPSPS